MLIDEIAKKNINKKIKKIKRMRTTIEIKTKIRTTLNFGWASAIPEERREIRRGDSIVTKLPRIHALPLDSLDDMVVDPLWLSRGAQHTDRRV
jgi:hypothetical protein